MIDDLERHVVGEGFLHREWLAPLTALLVISATAAADGVDRPSHRVPLVDQQVRADGVLDEPLWADALVLEARHEVRPGGIC